VTRGNRNSRASQAAAALLLLAVSAWGQGMSKGIMSPPANVRPPRLENVGIEQHLNAQVPPDLTFRDESGKTVKLGDYFGRKPLILNLVYYNCTMLCGEVLSGLTGTMRLVKFDIGKEFEVVTVSFDPRDKPSDARAKKVPYVARYGRPTGAAGWHFLTGPPASIAGLTEASGSATRGTRRSASSPMRARSTSRRPTAACRATSTGSSTRRGTCASRWSRPRAGRSERRSTSSSSTATTTTPPPDGTAPS